MKLRDKKNGQICSSSRFNTNAIAEIIVMFPEPDADMDSGYIRNYDVYLEAKKEWKDLVQSFIDRDIIVDNYNTIFFEPKNTVDRGRGYAL
jgi:hypothetical protein